MKNIHVNFNFCVICNSFLHNNNLSHIQTKIIEETDKKLMHVLFIFFQHEKSELNERSQHKQ